MYNLDTLGLTLMLMFFVLIAGYYLFSQSSRVHNKLPLTKKHDDFETGRELFPGEDLEISEERFSGDDFVTGEEFFSGEVEAFETGEEIFPLIQFPPEIEEEQVPELPWGYNDDKITIMARDPEWIFAYWDISAEKRSSLRHTIGQVWDNSLPVLRVYDVTGLAYFDGDNSNHYFDVVIDDFSGNWYVHTAGPDRTYCVELGRVLPDGAFIMMARSNLVSTPRNSISDRVDPEWMLVSEFEKKLFDRIGSQTGISSGEFFNRQ